MQLDELAASARGSRDLHGVGRNEQADIDSVVVHPFAGLGERRQARSHIEAAFGGDFLAPLRDQTNDFGFELEGDGNDLLRVCEFEVEPRLNQLA